jgi:hypothetical protein
VRQFWIVVLFLQSATISCSAIELCNNSQTSVFAAFSHSIEGKFLITTSGEVKSSECKEVGPSNLAHEFLFGYVLPTADGNSLIVPSFDPRNSVQLCVPRDYAEPFIITEQVSESECANKPNGTFREFVKLHRGERDSCKIEIKADNGLRENCLIWETQIIDKKITTAILVDKCLFSWEDSQQVHSAETIINWNYQAEKVTMRKLSHCMRLKVRGPVDIEGIAKAHVENCIHEGLESEQFKRGVELLAGIVADAYGLGGAGTAAAVTAIGADISDKTLSCLQDADRLEGTLKQSLGELYQAEIKHEQEWVFWNL